MSASANNENAPLPPRVYTQIEQPDRAIHIKFDKGPSKEDNFGTSDIIAIGAAIISLLSILYTNYIDRRSRKASIHDEYWMREVIYPIFMQSLIEFVRDAPKQYRDVGGEMDVFVECYALDALNDIRDNTLFLNAIDSSLPELAQAAVDEFDDQLEDMNDESDLKNALAEVSKKIVVHLKSAQEKV